MVYFTNQTAYNGKMTSSLIWLLLALSGVNGIYPQSDTSGLQATIPQNLIVCYRNISLLTREYLPPMTINSFLAIIRKLENLPGVFQDMRTLSSQIMNSYRMDGIVKNPDVAPSQYVTPYGPSGNEFFRYKILMDGLIPSSGNTFPDTALRMEEKCAIHMMLSASVDRNERGDESSVCNSLTNYVQWNSRVPRSYSSGQLHQGIRSDKDVEEFEPVQAIDPRFGKWMEGGFLGLSCPLENGVIRTRYGAIKMGLVLGGIAAGLQSQSVSRHNLILVAKANSLRGRQYKFPRLYTTDTNPNISNIWAATLSGEIAEVALLQGPLRNSQMRIGLNGGWNDSVLPRYFFLNEDNKDAMTDTDIRGSIDGLILGTGAQTWSNQVGGGGKLKLSQLLDMYYSDRGVLNTNVRACDRLQQFNSFTQDEIIQQSYAFSGVLELELPPAVNVEDAGLQNFNLIAVQKLLSYVASIQDTQCSFASTTYTNQGGGQVSKIVTPGINLYMVIDFNFDYLDAIRIVSQLAERLEVSRFTSNISVINARDTTIIVNSTNDILDMYANFTRDNYTRCQKGFDLARIVRDLGSILQTRLDLDRLLNTAGGPATVVLIVPTSTAVINDNDKNYIYNRLSDLRKNVPDARFMFLNPGGKEKFSSFVQDPSKDVFTLALTDIPTSIESVMTRLKEIPRRIINPTCTSSFNSGVATSNLVFRTYIEPVGGIQYFRIHPNYFYKTSGGSIKISSTSGRTLNICQSRVNTQPGNNSQSDSCRQITLDTYEIYINNACGDSTLSSCNPFYFSIAVVPSTSPSTASCTDDNCRYPDNVQVDIRQDGLTCASEGLSCVSNANVLLVVSVLLHQLLVMFNS